MVHFTLALFETDTLDTTSLILSVGYQAQIFVPLFPFFPGTLLARPRFQLNQPMLLNVIQDQE